MAKTRGVFALIFYRDGILLSERADGKGWNLPGGGVHEGETDEQALLREVEEETMLKVRVLYQVGPEHIFNEDTAVAYLCEIVNGDLQPTREAKSHRYCTAEEVKQGFFTDSDNKIEIKLIGPEGRLGRTGRMLWDGFSIVQVFEQATVNTDPITAKGNRLLVRTAVYQADLPRLDPYGPNGIMEEK